MPTIPSAVHIIHTDPVMTAGLHAILADRQEWRVSTHPSQPEARQAARVLVADYDTGLALARQPEHAGLRRPSVLIVTQLDKEWEVRLAMDAGVHGYVLQSCSQDELLEAVASLAQGQRYLSESVTRSVADSLSRETLTGRETDVLQLLAEGCCNKSIARRLGIGVGTVKTHVKGVMSKLDATARTHAVVVATQRGLIRPGSGIRSAYN
ncbi:DNA-binding NarL/FixJ family response regulator [Massilia sp. UYP32]|uniref:response regulator transcription factor n=1 Tax=unclassified Massilia TaxID=2609279 RepID=UPI001C62880E|nr:response regulator transcription factor [Massilia sp. NP310]QYG04189.1 response regulator transcription factor [Massilia sp. NP310]